MGKLLLLSVLILTACSKSNLWSRTRADSTSNPGTIVSGVDKESLENFLLENKKSGRIISESRMVYEIETVDTKEFTKKFPEALIAKNASFVIEDKKEASPLIIELTKEDAKAAAAKQLSWLNLEEAHKITKGRGVTVAIIDSGIAVDRWDLHDSLWINEGEIPDNLIDDDNNGYIDDVHGWNFPDNDSNLLDVLPHGTYSAGVIASSLTGIAPDAKVMGLKMLGRRGTSFSDIVEATIYALDNKADLINFSLGKVGELDAEVMTLINTLTESKIFISASAGNDTQNCDQNPFLATVSKVSNVMTVAALNLSPAVPVLASYSNYGDCVDIAAPSGIGKSEDAFARGIVTSNPYSQTNYALYFGTSAAAPVVTGVAALVKSLHPDWTPEQLKEHLKKTAIPMEFLNAKVASGIVNAFNAVK